MAKQAEMQFHWFQKKFYVLTQIDLKKFRENQMKRRIGTYMKRQGVRNYVEFMRILSEDEAQLSDFRDYLTINVSSFFRDKDKWEKLSQEYLPELIKQRKVISCWSAGCSVGYEVYTLALILTQLQQTTPFRYSLLATDIDSRALAKAKEGIFPEASLKSVFERQKKVYFEKLDKSYRIKPSLKSNILFQLHDLHNSPPKSGFDLILCRNVIIYFDDAAKKALFARFQSVLHEGGILFIGGSEVIFNPEKIGLVPLSMCFYRKLVSNV